MRVLNLNKDNFEDEVLKSEKKVLVDFYADWCGPCKMQGPIVDDVANELNEDVSVGKINVDDNSELAMKYGIMSIPTLLIFYKGEIINRFVGLTSKSELIDKLK